MVFQWDLALAPVGEDAPVALVSNFQISQPWIELEANIATEI